MPVGVHTPTALSVSPTCLCHSMSVQPSLEPRLPAPSRPDQRAGAARATPTGRPGPPTATWPQRCFPQHGSLAGGLGLRSRSPFSLAGGLVSHKPRKRTQIVSTPPCRAERPWIPDRKVPERPLAQWSRLPYRWDPALTVVFYCILLVKSVSCHDCPSVSTAPHLRRVEPGGSRSDAFFLIGFWEYVIY